MSKVVKALNAEETVINTIIGNVRDGKYIDTISKEESGYVINENVSIVSSVQGKSNRFTLKIKDKEFTGKMVRRLMKACELAITGRKLSGSKKKEMKSEDELKECWDLI